MDSINALISKNEYVRSYIFWTSILVIKMLFMSVLTGLTRFRTKTFSNPEDLKLAEEPNSTKKLTVKFNDPDVERFRRAHRNDLENVICLQLAGFFFIFTNPETQFAITLYSTAAISRILHTIVYTIIIIPQPARAIAFFVPCGVTIYMTIQTLTFANPEDLPSKKLKIKFDDPDVERVRRAHRNDLENILPLIAAAFLYAFTNPDTFIAVNIFRIAVISRIIHTIVYCVIIVPQPARAIAFFVPFIITAYMAVQTIIHFW